MAYADQYAAYQAALEKWQGQSYLYQSRHPRPQPPTQPNQSDNQMERNAAKTPPPTQAAQHGGQYQQSTASGQPPAVPVGGGNIYTNPNAGNTPPPDYSQLSSSGGPNYAADLAEKQREFDITTARDIAKQNASEVDSLQQRLASLSGPKDAYADYFFAHGLLPPQGYKPAPVPLTQAQISAYGQMGTSPQQLQAMISGTGKPGADTGMLGSLGQSLQTPPGMPQFQAAQAPTQPQASSNPTVQGGALYGKTPPVPSMAQGGQVPGQPGTPSLAVVHGGEQVTPAADTPQPQPGAQQSFAPAGQGIHPAIAGLIDAMSNLLAAPEFAPFVQGALANKQATPGQVPSMAMGGVLPGAPPGATPPPEALTQQTPPTPPSGTANIAKPSLDQMDTYRQTGRYNQSPTAAARQPALDGGRAGAGGFDRGAGAGQNIRDRGTDQSGSAPPSPRTPPVSGLPQAGAQQVSYNTGAPGPADNPIMPIANMDPYTRALYDVHGRLRPYSAQQQQQMGPQGLDAVNSYIGKVQGGDIKAYTDLVDRLKSTGAPSSGGGGAGEGFRFG